VMPAHRDPSHGWRDEKGGMAPMAGREERPRVPHRVAGRTEATLGDRYPGVLVDRA
jgi:hypothetical protein